MYQDVMNDFDPNAAPTRVWATFVPGRRSGSFKTHSERGKALNAINFAHSGILYRYENDQWVEVARKEGWEDRDRCDFCGGDGSNQWGYTRLTWTWYNKKSKQHPRIGILCGDCESGAYKNLL